MSLLNKHLVEILTEGKFTTVAIYFNTEAEVAKQAAQAPQAPGNPAPMPRSPYRERAVAPPPWGGPRLNEMSDAEVAGSFPFIEQAIPHKIFLYKASHEMAATLQRGDSVVVAGANNGFMVGKVWQVHQTAQIDYDAPYAYRWLVQKIDTTAFDDHMQKEKQFVAMLQESEKARQRAQARESLLASVRPIDPEALEVFKAGLALLGVSPAAAGVVEAQKAAE